VLDWANNQSFWVPIHPLMLTDNKVIRAVVSTLAN
jgi:hypothetical protein